MQRAPAQWWYCRAQHLLHNALAKLIARRGGICRGQIVPVLVSSFVPCRKSRGNQRRPYRFVDQGHCPLFVVAIDPDKRIEREGAAKEGGCAQEIAAGLVQVVQALLNRQRDALRQFLLSCSSAFERPDTITQRQLPFQRERAHQLFEKERIAPGACQQHSDCALRQLTGQQGVQMLCGGFCRERAERQNEQQPLAHQFAQGPGGRLSRLGRLWHSVYVRRIVLLAPVFRYARSLRWARGAEQENTAAVQAHRQVEHQFQARAIGPLQVIDAK